MKLSSASQVLVLLSSTLPTTFAWGGLGHETVAFIASGFVNSQTQTFFQHILGDSSTEYLANVATWADSYRNTKAGLFSEPFHFIDSKDNPPSSCSVVYNRDCGANGCVVEAIQNYTARLMDAGMDAAERVEAAKFVIHFVGDIHQPLHDENLDRGGNSINVTFGGTPVNLHAIWDTNMPEKIVGGSSLADAQNWAVKLSSAITNGEYKSQAASWIDGMNINDPVSTTMVWATEANTYVCSTVMPHGPGALEGQELDGDYYLAAAPVIELQIARAGYRLAAWMNLIAKGSSNLKHSEL